ncbi:acyl transferase domain protein, partial [Mycobacterium xenopi 3993]
PSYRLDRAFPRHGTPGDEIDVRVDRVGIDQGAEVVEVAARIGSDLVMSATARLARRRPSTRSPVKASSTRDGHGGAGPVEGGPQGVGRRGQIHPRNTGFSVLHVVRDNPTSIIASGVHYHHPDGVLYLTQFTQVAMATVAAAQVAEMREAGAFVEGAIACGHSVGEYTALACVTGIYELEALLEMVFHRGSKMHDIVPATSWAARTTGWPQSGRRRSTSTTPTCRRSSPRSPSAQENSWKSSTTTCAARSTRSPARSAAWRRWKPRWSAVVKSPAASGLSSWCPASTCLSIRGYCASVSPNFAVRWTGSCRATRIPT